MPTTNASFIRSHTPISIAEAWARQDAVDYVHDAVDTVDVTERHRDVFVDPDRVSVFRLLHPDPVLRCCLKPEVETRSDRAGQEDGSLQDVIV